MYMHPHIHTWIYEPVCVCVWCVQEYGFFPLVLLAWLGFTLKVADHLRQMLLLNGLNEWKPGSTKCKHCILEGKSFSTVLTHGPHQW